jgi:small-conductance mechanosensitive channel
MRVHRHRLVVLATGLIATAALLFQSSDSSAALPEPAQVVSFLNQSIDWYRNAAAEQRLAEQPAEVLFVYNDRQLANQILSLSFDYARGVAQLLTSLNSSSLAPTETQAGTAQNLAQLISKADAAIQQKQSALAAMKQKLPSTQGHARTILESTIAETESGIDLQQTRLDTLKTLLQFTTGNAPQKGEKRDLLTQISELEQSVPEAHSESTTTNAAQPSQQSPSNANSAITVPTNTKPPASGILGLGSDLWSLRNKIQTLNDGIQKTSTFRQDVRTAMSPLASSLQDSARQADDLSNQPPVNDAATIAQRTNQIEALQSQFKQYSAVFLPLAKQRILLDRYLSQLTSWRDSVEATQKDELKSLAVRLITLAIILAIAAFISEVWRRVTVRYVPDVRRRHQFLLVRRIVMFVVYAIIIAFSFSTDLGSFTTFAGLIVAGLAVSMQNVIQSAVGYFILLGKYGVRVGDRIQIAGTTGNVVDVDLMRLSLMEVGDANTGVEGMPTGRTVEFPNAIVFQPTAGFFKQIPGTDFRWHEVTLTLATDSDYTLLEKRILKAVNAVFATYRGSVEQQYRSMERTLNLPVEMPAPQSRLRFTQSSLEMIIRYPVTREHTADIDDQITRALLDVMKAEPEVKSVGSPSAASAAASASGSAPASSDPKQIPPAPKP